MVALPDNVHPIFAKQADCLARADADGLAETYHPDAVVVRFQGVLRGREMIRETFAKYMKLGAQTVEVLDYVDTDDTIMVRSNMSVMGEGEVGYGTYVLRDGLVWRHTAGIEGPPRDWFKDAADRGIDL